MGDYSENPLYADHSDLETNLPTQSGVVLENGSRATEVNGDGFGERRYCHDLFMKLVYLSKSRRSLYLVAIAAILLLAVKTLQIFIDSPQEVESKAVLQSCIGNEKPRAHIVILKSPQFPSWTKVDAEEFEIEGNQLKCDHVIFHAATRKYIEMNSKLVNHQIEWAENFPNDCFLNVSPSCRPPARGVGFGTQNATELAIRYRKDAKYEIKFHSTNIVQDLIKRKRIIASDGFLPWAMFTDVDYIFPNRKKGMKSVIDRLESGFAYKRNKTRLYYTAEDRLFDSLVKTHRVLPENPPGFEDLAFAIAFDSGSWPRWLYNSGAYVFRPCLVTSFLWDAALVIYNHTSVLTDPDFHHTGDQGILSTILRDAFNLVSRFHRSMGSKIEKDLWDPPCDDNELLAVHRINLTSLFKHPILAQVARKWFPDGTVPAGEPDSAAVVCSRWFNSPACIWVYTKRDERFRSQRFHCDDFAGHLYGCGKDSFELGYFRDQIISKCKGSFSYKTNKDGTPFTWEKFKNLQ